MRTFIRNIVATVVLMMSLFVNSAKGQTGSVYPVDLNVMLTPPFGTCLTDLTNTNRFIIQALLRDMNHGNDYKMVIQMRVKSLSSLNTVFLSHTKPFSIGMGKPTVVLSANQSKVSISDFFDESNVLAVPGSVRLNNNCLPEGSYMFCFQAFDATAYYGGQRIPISKEFSVTAFLEEGAAPILVSPKNNEMIPCDAQDINFMWQQPFVTSGLNTYTLQIAEVTSPDFDSPQVLETGALIEEKGLMVPMKNIHMTGTNFQKGYSYYWRVVMCDKNGTPRVTYPNKGASPAFKFTYCGEEKEEPEDEWQQQVPVAKAIGEGLDTLRIDTVLVDEATTCTAYWFKDSVEVREKYQGVIIEVKKTTQDTWTPFKLESSVRTDTTISLSSLSYNDSFMVRGQYYMLEDGNTIYAPYSDTVYFRIKHPADTLDCGAPIPDLTDCSGSGERSEFHLGDEFTANGTTVTIDSITSQRVNGSSVTISGLGHLPFPILSNFGLKVSFTDVEINCDNQLKKGKVISVYDEKTAAMIDLNNIIGKGSKGNDLSQSDAVLNDGGGDVSNLQEGDLVVNDGTVTMKDADGNEITVGTVIDLSSSSVYSDNTSLKDKDVYVKFSNPDYEHIAFDDDEQNLRKSSYTLAGNYRDFGGGYIVPWTASNPGRKFQLTATPSKDLKSEGYTDVKFVIPASAGKYIDLETSSNDDGSYSVSIPGMTAGVQSVVYAIARKGADKPYENVGKMNLCCYSYKSKKLVVVPLVAGITVSADEVKTALEKIYGKLGYTFEVEVDNAHSNGVRSSIALESTVMSEFSSDMKEVINGYKANIDADDSYSYDKSAAYLFLMDKPEGSFAETKGIMPQKQQFGFIFMQGSQSVSTAETHTMAHELGHGLFGLDHVFIKSYGIGEGTTQNLMDYTKKTPDDFLSYHEWSQIDNPVMSWSLFNSDEGNMYKPWTFVGSELVYYLYDRNIPMEKNFCVLDYNGDKFMLPSNATNIYFDNCKVVSFQIGDELWLAMFDSKKRFVGYFSNLFIGDDFESPIVEIFENNKYNDNVDEYPDYIYMPNFYDSEESDCVYYDIHKVYNPKFETSYVVSNPSDLVYIDLDADKTEHEIVYDKQQYGVNCLPYRVKRFYVFMINHYEYFKNNIKAQNLLLSYMSKCRDVIIKGYDENEYGDNYQSVLDNFNKENVLEYSLSSDKLYMSSDNSKNFEDFIKKLKNKDNEGSIVPGPDNKTIDLLAITFDNWSVYKDYYQEGHCTKAQWEQDMNAMNEMVNKVKKKKEKDIYDFCNLVMNTCEDWLKTVDYKILQNYISFIVEETDKTILSKFNNLAENAVLKIMRSINVNDYKEFVNYLCSDDKTHGRLVFRFMNIFDDRHLGYGDDNYKEYVTQLITMYKANRRAFLGDEFNEKSEDELDLFIKDKIIDLSEGILMAPEITLEFKKTGNVTLYKNYYEWRTDYNSQTPYQVLVDSKVMHGYEDVSPFSPIYFKVNPSDPEYVASFKDIASYDEKKESYYLVCPLIFLKYRENKVIQRNLLATAAIVATVVAVVPAAEYLGTIGAKQFISYLIKKQGESFLFDFGVGALMEFVCTEVACSFTHDEIKNNDLLLDMCISGLDNAFSFGRKMKSVAACVSGPDVNDLLKCLIESENRINPCVKVGLDCFLSGGLTYCLSSKKMEDAILKAAAFVKKPVFKLYTRFSPETEIKIINKLFKLSDKWTEAMIKFASDNPNAFKLLQENNINYGIFSENCIRQMNTLIPEIGETEFSKLVDRIAKGHDVNNIVDFMYKLRINVTRMEEIVDKNSVLFKNLVEYKGQNYTIWTFFNMTIDDELKMVYKTLKNETNPNVVDLAENSQVILKYSPTLNKGVEMVVTKTINGLTVTGVKIINNLANWGVDITTK